MVEYITKSRKCWGVEKVEVGALLKKEDKLCYYVRTPTNYIALQQQDIIDKWQSND